MRSRWMALGIGLAVAATACTMMQDGSATATLRLQNGTEVGTAKFTTVPEGTRVVLELRGVSDGLHGSHVHSVASCQNSQDASGNAVIFGGAGAHFDPKDTKVHGKPENPETVSHAGVLPNTEVKGGAGRLEFVTKKLTVAPGPLSVAGRSVIVHVGTDDFTTQPTGNSGARLACGVIL